MTTVPVRDHPDLADACPEQAVEFPDVPVFSSQGARRLYGAPLAAERNPVSTMTEADRPDRPSDDAAPNPRERGREMSTRWLPPLTAMRTFEAVGRAGMAGAAMELNVTPAAINHQLRALEADLGIKLFSRTKTGLVLNNAGRDYLSGIGASFDLLYEATRRVKGPLREHRLVVECLISFANDFIIPRLSSFYQAYPDIELEFRTMRRARAKLDLAQTGAHVAINGGNVAGQWPGLNAERLAYEVFFPVCSPKLQMSNDPLLKPSDLMRHTLLVVTGAPEGWREWIEAAQQEHGEDLSHLPLANALRFDSFHSASLAAAHGIGVDLGRAPLVNHMLQDGTLVEPFDVRVRSTASYWLLYSDSVAELQAFTVFRDWLMQELEDAGALP